MDVTCERCSTAYEFDDALISERGTMVRCTNCDHQFRIRRAETVGTPERWVVRTVDGRELEFRALRELQAAIDRTHVTRDDVLSRGAGRPRRLGSIAELEPFFMKAVHNPNAGTMQGLGQRPRIATPHGLGVLPQPPPPYEGSVAIPLPAPPVPDDDAAPTRPPMHGRRPASVPPPVPRNVLPGVVVGPGSAPPVPHSNAPATQQEQQRSYGSQSQPGHAPQVYPQGGFSQPQQAQQPAQTPAPRIAVGFQKTLPVPHDNNAPTAQPAPVVEVARAGQNRAREMAATITSPPVQPAVTASYGTPRANLADVRPSEPRVSDGGRYSSELHAPSATLTPTPSNIRASYTNEEYIEPRFASIEPRKRAGAARWVVGFVLAGMVALFGLTVGRKFILSAAGQGTQAGDERITGLVHEGEKSLAEGDLESAQEHLDKASALAENDPRVAKELAHLAVVRGDVSWLRAKLVAADDPDRDATLRAVGVAAERAKKATDRAAALAPGDSAVVRARIDALRLAGDVPAARKLVSGIASTSTQPETALSLAALDFDETKPDWATVIERLRAGLAAEQNLGRARSLLIFALARSGDVAAAKTELDKLAALPRPHPLTQPLRAFLARSGGGDPGADAASEGIKKAHDARAKGDLKKAQALYEGAAAKDPGNVEALTGAAECAKARKDNAGAIAAYGQILDAHPDDVPTLSALADLQWDTGDKKGAIARYKLVIEKGEKKSPLVVHAKERVEGKAAAAAPAAEPAPAGRAPAGRNGGGDDRIPDDYVPPANGSIDTSDLPGSRHAPAPASPAPPPQASAPAATAEHPTPAPPPAPAPHPAAPGPPPGVDTSDLPGFK